METKKGCKVLSIFLIFMLTLSVATTGKIQAYAVVDTDKDGVSKQKTVDSYNYSYLITGFDELADDIRWQNTKEPNLPEYVTGTVEGKTANIPVSWEADHDYDAAFPESGLYVFTAKVGEGYTIAQGVEAPRITVYIPAGRRIRLFMSGSATENDPLVITTAAQLAEIAVLVNRGRLESFIFNNSNATVYLKLGNDIDLSLYGMNWNRGKGWIPIGTYTNPFKSHFDGDGKTITGLYINDDTLLYAGLFEVLKGGSIQALALEDVHISGNDYTGGVAEGIYGNSVVQYCYATGSIKGNTSSGLAGGIFENGVVKNCYSSASVSGISKAGGVAGFVENGTMESCYYTGEVKCGDSTGITGGVAGGVENGTVKNCAAFNSIVKASGSNVGRIAGHNEGTLMGNAAFSGMTVTMNGSTKTPDSNPEGPDGKYITAAQIKTDGTIGNRFTAEGGWTTEPGKLPGLFGKTVEMPEHIKNRLKDYFTGSGSSETDPYLITNAAQLARLAELVNSDDETIRNKYNNKYYKLMADIDLSDYGKNYRDGKGWVPIGNETKPFKGHFNGNYKIISGLYINDSDLNFAGLFGYIESGSAKNLGLKDVNITGKDYVGGLVGYNADSTVECCYASGVVNGSENVGGLIGAVYNGTVKDAMPAVILTTVKK